MQTQFVPKLSNSSGIYHNIFEIFLKGYGQKKIIQQTQPKNLPQGETFELTIDIVQDKVCLFAKKDDKLYEAIETLLLEKDIVNIVNQKPEILKKDQNMQLRYEGFPLIELKQVEEFFSPSKANEQKTEQQQEENQDQVQITVESMYDELNYQYKKDLQQQKQFYEIKRKEAEEELIEMQKRFADLDRMKKELRENEIIKTLTAKIQLQEKEIEKLPVYIALIEEWENTKEKINQLHYLKMAHYCDCLQEDATRYYLQKTTINIQFQQFQDDIRRLKARKAIKEAEEFEKKIANLEPEYSQLQQSEFFMKEYQKIDYDFLNCDETIVYKQQIAILQEQLEEYNQQVQIAQNLVLQKKKEFNDFKLSVDKVSIETNDIIEKKNFAKKQIQEKQQQIKDNQHWKDKFNQLQRIIYDMKIKQDNRIKGLESHILIKDTQVKQIQKEVDEKDDELKIKKNYHGEKGQEERHKMLQDEIANQKKITTNYQERIGRQQAELNARREQKARANAELYLIEIQINELEENQREVQNVLQKQYDQLKEIQKLKQENQQLSQQNKKQKSQLQILKKRAEETEQLQRNSLENQILLENQIELQNAFIRKKESEILNLQLKIKLKKSG